MTKKKKRYYDDFEDESDELFSDVNAPLDEFDVIEMCGDRNAQKGRALQAIDAVTMRSFDGSKIRGTVRQGASQIPLLLDLADFSTVCSDVNHARATNPYCEHIAALMYTFIDEPESFVPHSIGEAINLMQQSPGVLKDMGVSQEQFDAVMHTLQSQPPEARAALENLPLEAAAGADRPPEEEMKERLRGLSLQQMRGIAQRRGWDLAALPKEKLVEQLAENLKQAPLPAEFSPEEDQFLRIQNTVLGLSTEPTAQSLDQMWKKRGGGDLARLERAVRGLQAAGILFPCTQESQELHYHWSPFVESADLPLLAPKTKFYPPEKIERLLKPDLLPPVLPLADAIVELAEREPLRLQSKQRDERFAKLPYVRDWEFEPHEIEQVSRNRAYGGALVLTIPLIRLWASDTLKVLETMAGSSSDLGGWVASTLTGLGILKQTDAHARVDPKSVQLWRAQTPMDHARVLWEAWHVGGVAMLELRTAAERASLVVQRSSAMESFTPLELAEEIALARQFVVRLLVPLEPLTWYSWKSFAEYVRDIRSDFLHTFTSEHIWFLAAAKTRHRYNWSNTQHWDAAYRPVLAAMFEGPLRWMGAVDVLHDGKDLAAFQITPLGAWLVSEGQVGSFTELTPAEEPGGEPVRWLDDSTVRLRATSEAVRVMPLVRAFADPTRELLTFRVSNDSLARALDSGVTVAEIGPKFDEIGAPLPSALRERMAALEANYGRVHLYEHLAVLELADDMALRELLAGTSLSQYIVHQFSPRLVTVREEGVDELMNEFVKKGYTPRKLEVGS
ncbi:MAG: helicase-associated domain-containing protein [Chloroflexi bacterium]|nr:helicase-associated domain-containing protein [Chloroflexota bacterium]